MRSFINNQYKVKSVDEAKNPVLGKLIAAKCKEASESIAKIHKKPKKEHR